MENTFHAFLWDCGSREFAVEQSPLLWSLRGTSHPARRLQGIVTAIGRARLELTAQQLCHQRHSYSGSLSTDTKSWVNLLHLHAKLVLKALHLLNTKSLWKKNQQRLQATAEGHSFQPLLQPREGGWGLWMGQLPLGIPLGAVPAFCTPAPTFCAVSQGIRTPAGSVVFRASDLASCFSFFFFSLLLLKH